MPRTNWAQLLAGIAVFGAAVACGSAQSTAQQPAAHTENGELNAQEANQMFQRAMLAAKAGDKAEAEKLAWEALNAKLRLGQDNSVEFALSLLLGSQLSYEMGYFTHCHDLAGHALRIAQQKHYGSVELGAHQLLAAVAVQTREIDIARLHYEAALKGPVNEDEISAIADNLLTIYEGVGLTLQPTILKLRLAVYAARDGGPVGNAQVAYSGNAVPQAEQAIAPLRPQFRACYERARATKPDAQGKVTLTLRVGQAGTVVGVRATSEGSLPASVADCLRWAATGAKFGELSEPSTVEVPVELVAPKG